MADLDPTNPVPEAPPPAQAEDDPEDREVEAEGEAEDPDAEDADAAARQAAAEDEEEVEVGGKKYVVPKALIAERMMQADYARKTQETAAERKALAAEREAFRAKASEDAKLDGEIFQSRAQLWAIDNDLQAYLRPGVWEQIKAHDAQTGEQTYLEHMRRFNELQLNRTNLDRDLTDKQGKRTLAQQQETAKQREEAQAAYLRRVNDARPLLAKEIGWGPELAKKVEEFGVSQGLTIEELQAMEADPRFVKIAHYARLGYEFEKKQKAPPPRREASVPPEPVRQAGTSRQPATTAPSDKDDINTWMRKEQARIKRKRA